MESCITQKVQKAKELNSSPSLAQSSQKGIARLEVCKLTYGTLEDEDKFN